AAPVEMIDRECEIAAALGDGVQHLDAGGDDLGADAVARNGCDPVGLHADTLWNEPAEITDRIDRRNGDGSPPERRPTCARTIAEAERRLSLTTGLDRHRSPSDHQCASRWQSSKCD